MATLFERLIGLNLPEGSQLPEEQKMPIHGFDGSMDYIGTTIPTYGAVTGAQIAGWFNLDAAQQQQMIYLSALIDDAQAAGVRTAFSRANKNYMYNGEWGTAPQWQDEDAYWLTLQNIITTAGGTPTVKPW